MRLTYHYLLAFMLVFPLSTTSTAAGDPKLGKPLHDKQCIACHVQKFGGDGSKMYSRAERKIATLAALQQRVATCSANTNAGWFPDDEENVAAWLNQQYYKFK